MYLDGGQLYTPRLNLIFLRLRNRFRPSLKLHTMQSAFPGQQPYPYYVNGPPANQYFTHAPMGSYPPPGPSGGLTDYGHFYASQPTPFAPPVAGAFNGLQGAAQLSGQTPRMPRPKHFTRPQTPGANLPRKSAMKKSASASGVPLVRPRANSGTGPPPAQVVRQRTNSNPSPNGMIPDFFPR